MVQRILLLKHETINTATITNIDLIMVQRDGLKKRIEIEEWGEVSKVWQGEVLGNKWTSDN